MSIVRAGRRGACPPDRDPLHRLILEGRARGGPDLRACGGRIELALAREHGPHL